MTTARDPLVRHLSIAVALKLVVLFALWWAFIRDDRVGADIDRVAAHLGAPADASSRPSSSSGAQP